MSEKKGASSPAPPFISSLCRVLIPAKPAFNGVRDMSHNAEDSDRPADDK